MDGKALIFIPLITVLFCSVFSTVKGVEDTIVCNLGLTPDIDGVVDATEWQDATSMNFDVLNPMEELRFTGTFYAKHDEANLYLAMYLPDTTPEYVDFVEICFDPNNDKSAGILPDDLGYWLYRNGEAIQVRPEGTTPPYDFTWQMANDSEKWQFEFALPYSELGITAGESKTIGFAFMILDNPGAVLDMGFYYFPEDYEGDSPQTYGNITSEVNWIPEFPSAIILPLVMLAILITTIVTKKRKSKP